jgi:hypothetical protein
MAASVSASPLPFSVSFSSACYFSLAFTSDCMAALKQQAFDGTHSAFSAPSFSFSSSKAAGGFGTGFRANLLGLFALSLIFFFFIFRLWHIRFRLGFSAPSPVLAL